MRCQHIYNCERESGHHGACVRGGERLFAHAQCAAGCPLTRCPEAAAEVGRASRRIHEARAALRRAA